MHSNSKCHSTTVQTLQSRKTMFFALLYLFQLTLVWHQKSYPRITLNSWKPLYCIKLQRWDDESAWERRKYGPGHYALLCFVQGRPWRLVMLYWLLGEKKEVLQWLLAPISCHRNSPIRSHCQSRKALQRLLTNKLPCLGSKLPAFTEDPWKEKKKKASIPSAALHHPASCSTRYLLLGLHLLLLWQL